MLSPVTAPELSAAGSRALSRAEAVARAIETDISSGAVLPGDSLGTKDELRRRFGVAVATVNEAIKLLGARGLVEARPGPGGGVFVSAPGNGRRLPMVMGFGWAEATMADYHEVRAVLEPLILRHAATHRTEDDLAELEAIVDRMESELSEPSRYLRDNTAFHRRVAAISPNVPLRSLYVTVLDFFQHAVDVAQLPGRMHGHNADVHRRLLEAIRSGMAAELRAALRAHDRHRRGFGLGTPPTPPAEETTR